MQGDSGVALRKLPDCAQIVKSRLYVFCNIYKYCFFFKSGFEIVSTICVYLCVRFFYHKNFIRFLGNFDDI